MRRINLRKKRTGIVRYLFEYLSFFFLAFIEVNRLCRTRKFCIIQCSNIPDFLVFTTILLIQQYCLQHCIFLMGKIPHADMMLSLKNMDIGILPIRKNSFTNLSFSNKISEFIHFKIPVVSSDLDSLKYYFSDREITYFNSGDPFDLSEKLCFAYKNRHIMKNRAIKAFEAYQPISWAVMKHRYLDTVLSLLKQTDDQMVTTYRRRSLETLN